MPSSILSLRWLKNEVSGRDSGFFTVSLVRADAIKHLTFVYKPCNVPMVVGFSA